MSLVKVEEVSGVVFLEWHGLPSCSSTLRPPSSLKDGGPFGWVEDPMFSAQLLRFFNMGPNLIKFPADTTLL